MGLMLVARYSKAKLALYAALAGGFVAIGLWILQKPEPGLNAVLAAWGCLIFFGGGGVLFLLRLFDNEDVLRIDATGIYDRRIVSRIVPWSAIEAITEYRYRRQVFYYLHLNRPLEEFVDSRLKRSLMSLNRFFGGGHSGRLAVVPAALTEPRDRIRAAIEAHRPITA